MCCLPLPEPFGAHIASCTHCPDCSHNPLPKIGSTTNMYLIHCQLNSGKGTNIDNGSSVDMMIVEVLSSLSHGFCL